MQESTFEAITHSCPEDDELDQALHRFDRTHKVLGYATERLYNNGPEVVEDYEFHFDNHIAALTELAQEVLEGEQTTPTTARLTMMATVLTNAHFQRSSDINKIAPSDVASAPDPTLEGVIEQSVESLQRKLNACLSMTELRDWLIANYKVAVKIDVYSLMRTQPIPPTPAAKIGGLLRKYGKEVGRGTFELMTGGWLFRVIGPHM
jgi:hypothetical protein